MALAFVEPTNEICEIRQGNDTHNHVYNYTKVKTGFFRRELLWHKVNFDEETDRKLIRQTAMDVVPIYVAGQNKQRFKSSSRNKSTSDATTNHVNQSMVEITPQEQEMTFNPRNISFVFKKLKDQQTSLYQDGNRLSLKTLNSNRHFSESKNFINNTELYRLHSKRGPTSKTRLTNSTLQTTTSPVLAHAINSKHLWRFNKSRNSPGENENGKRPTKNFNKTHWKHHFNNRNHRHKVKKPSKIDGTNLTSNLASPARNIGKKNDNSSTDKRRQNKPVPPVVIEFSRIVIPHGKGISDNSDDSSGNYQVPNIRNVTKFVPHKTVFHSTQHLEQVSDSISEPLLSETGLLPPINNSANQVNRTDVKAISDSLLQLEEKLSKIIGFDSKSTTTENGDLFDASTEKVHKMYASNASVSDSSFNRSPTETLQIRMRNKNVSKEIDKLHQEEEQKSDTEILLNTGMSVLNAANYTHTMMTSKGQNITNQSMPPDDSLSGSGSTLFESSSHETNDHFAFHELQTDTRESNDTTLQNSYNNFTQNNVSYHSPGNAIKNYTKTIQGEFMKNTPQPAEHSDPKLQVWMTNLLKTNSYELKRIFTILLVLVVVGEFLEAPSATLADASLLEHLGEERRYYGKQRLWGSLGFGLSSFLVGVLLERSRHFVCGEQYTDYMICFCVFAILMVMTLFISTTFKFQYKETDVKQTSVLSALCNIHYGSCLMAACFMGIGHGMSHSFLNWFLEDLGATKTLMGVAVICRSSLDLLTFFVAGSLIKAVGQIKIMICALISYGVAFTLYSLLTNPWWVLPIEMLVGCTYAASWSACTSYMAGAASSESVTTIQGNKI